MASIRIYASILVVMSLLSLGSSETGIGTINNPPYLPSACYGFQDQGVMIAAVNQDLWQGGAACGKNFQVTCTGATNQGVPHPCTDTPTVTVMITDFCPPPGCKGDLDLSHEAFSTIADPRAGGIKISYQQV
ncbi:EG45-like domain containing protein [Helianthus annuus]|uniref:EG45-like domain containing protein n=1 Tax=Helianthus annuus TaxID=4232 RepID=UPI001652E56F|nr:EG45-like domain containing protein [Helianthus annuus]